MNNASKTTDVLATACITTNRSTHVMHGWNFNGDLVINNETNFKVVLCGKSFGVKGILDLPLSKSS